jgi:hypothetical protein
MDALCLMACPSPHPVQAIGAQLQETHKPGRLLL